MIRKLSLSLVAALPATLTAGSFGPELRPQDNTFPAGCCAIHLIHVVGGEFLMWRNASNPGLTNSWTWNAFTGKFSSIPIPIGADVFCCGVSQLPDGRPIIAGGNMLVGFGINKTFIFNPNTGQWSPSGDLNENRWYPTLAKLADGTMTAISGWAVPDNPNTPLVDETEWNRRIDEFNLTSGAWSDFMPTPGSGVHPSGMQPHFYPFMFPYYDGAAPTANKLFFAGRSTVHGIGEGYNFKTYSLSFAQGGGAGVWSLMGGTLGSQMQGSGAVIMINRTDPIDAGTVYKFGGVVNSEVVRWGRKINLNDGPLAQWIPTVEMPAVPDQKRAECNVVAMADGRIALVGGTTATQYHSLANTGVNNIIIYNPATDAYDEISPNFAGTRMYHSTSVYSPTGTIFLAGGEYKEPNPEPPPQFVHKSNHTAQEYYPTYFEVDAVRPIITASRTTANWDTTILVTATGPIDHFSLLKLSSTTHANDTTQRYIKLTEVDRSGNNYQLKMPKNGGVAPPGQYMLFAISTYGVPSVAKYIRVGP